MMISGQRNDRTINFPVRKVAKANDRIMNFYANSYFYAKEFCFIP